MTDIPQPPWVSSVAIVHGSAGGTASWVNSTTPLPVYNPAAYRGVGITASASFTPAAAAYGAGDIMDVAKEFAFTLADGTAVPSGSLIRILTASLKIDTTGLQSGEGAYVLHPYSVTPPSAQADNAAWTLASADLPSYFGAGIALGTPVDLGAALVVRAQGLDYDVKLSGTSLFAELVTTPAFTATAVARQVLLRGIIL